MSARFRTFAVYSAGGAPLEGATPTFAEYLDFDGNPRSPPSIVEFGDGIYGFQPSDSDFVAETAYLIETTGYPAYYAGGVGQGVVWGCYNSSDLPFSGAIPLFLLYDDFAGTPQSAPTIVNIGGGLFGFMPTTADIKNGRAYHIDNGSGARPAYISGLLEPPETIFQDSIFTGIAGQPLDGSSGPATSLGRDLEIDLNTRDLVFRSGDLSLTKDAAAIAQDIDMRLRFWKGEWFLDPEVGVPYLEKILVKPPRPAEVNTLIRELLLAVPGVLGILALRVEYEGQFRNLKVSWNVSTDFGELNGLSAAGV